MLTRQPSTVRAVFFPATPETLAFDLRPLIERARQAGMTLYANAAGRCVMAHRAPAGFARYGSPEHSALRRQLPRQEGEPLCIA